MHMERQLVPTRPYNTVLRPGDGKMPDNIAYIYVQDQGTIPWEIHYAHRFAACTPLSRHNCCWEHLPMADVTIYYMDIRAFGKGYQEFFEQSRGMGIEFVRSRVAKITEKENGDLELRYENIENGGEAVTAVHDLVVLSVGLLPNISFMEAFNGHKPDTNQYNYVLAADELVSPSRTSMQGVFVAGTATGPMDIPDTILSAGNASAETAAYLKNLP